jgi:hypothetical protein
MSKEHSDSQTREQWLENAVAEITPLFEAGGYKVPRIRVSVGWPSSSAMARKNRTIGEFWAPKVSSDNLGQIFISPTLPGLRALDVLVHEMVHGVVGANEKHNAKFRKCAVSVGLEGKMTATVAGAKLLEDLKAVVEKIGAYPHGILTPTERASKSQTTRLVKCECADCGYNVRVTRKWLEHGAPICPCNRQEMAFEIPKELGPKDE